MPWLSPVAPGTTLALAVAGGSVLLLVALLAGAAYLFRDDPLEPRWTPEGGYRPAIRGGYQPDHQPVAVRPPVGGSGESGRDAR